MYMLLNRVYKLVRNDDGVILVYPPHQIFPIELIHAWAEARNAEDIGLTIEVNERGAFSITKHKNAPDDLPPIEYIDE